MKTILRPTLGLVAGVLPLLVPLAAVAADDTAQILSEARATERLYFGDEVAETATRSPKSISQIAENVTIIHAAEIEAMNAHSLAEVLNRVTGVFVEFSNGLHFGTIALPHLQGSGTTGSVTSERHVTLLLDGIPWNSLGGNVPLSTIPVGIIDRIEILKGPASSTWGSALGGVINVLTKKVGNTCVPSAEVSASYGEWKTWDARAEAAGLAGPVGYFLQGQAQHADWDDAGAEYKERAFFAKAKTPMGSALTLSLTAGQSRPQHDAGDLTSFAALAQDNLRTRFVQAGLDARLGETLTLHAGAFHRSYRLDQETQEDGTYAPAGALLQNNAFAEVTRGADARAAWTPKGHAVVVGVDYVSGDMTWTTDSGDYYQTPPPDGPGFPPRIEARGSLDRVGVYANDTMALGLLTVTPGLRHDRASKGGSFTSPSLGATLQLGADTLLRGSLARGFTLAPLTDLAGRAFSWIPNPDLKPERVFSWQVGAESHAVPALWLKASVFRHESTDSIEVVPAAVEGFSTTTNKGSVRRTGFEVEAETAAWQGLSSKVGFAFTRVHEVGQDRNQDEHQTNLGLSYRRGTFSAQLLGHYVWWDLGRGFHEGKHDDLLWDLTASKGFALDRWLTAELFGSLHNVLNGDQNPDPERGTESRWAEVGMRFRL